MRATYVSMYLSFFVCLFPFCLFVSVNNDKRTKEERRLDRCWASASQQGQKKFETRLTDASVRESPKEALCSSVRTGVARCRKRK